MKKILTAIAICTLLALGLATGAVASNVNHKAYFVVDQSSYNVDGQSKNMDAATFVEGGRTYVPLRFLAYALGVAENDVKWADPVATLSMGDTTVRFSLKSKGYQVNDASKTMDTTPLLRGGRIYLPARFVAEAFGYEVGWDNVKRAVLIGPRGELPGLPVIDLTGQGEPIAGKPWAERYFRGANSTEKIVYKNVSDLANQSFKVGTATTVLELKVTKDNITVKVAIPEKERFGGTVYLYENDNVVRIRDGSPRPENNKDPVYDFEYPVFAHRDAPQGFTPKADISKVKYIFLKRGYTIIAFGNPLYTGK